jgi:hypothetical protein
VFGVILPYTPKGSYEAIIEMTPRIGLKDLNFQIPIGSRCCMVVTNGWRGKIGGLDLVGGRQADENRTRIQPYKPVENQLYQFRIVVRVLGERCSIQVFLNKQPYIAWKGLIEDLSMRPDWVVGEGKTLGFLGVASSATLKSVKVRGLGG